MDRRGYSIISLVIALGGDRAIAYTISLTVAASVGVACILVGRRGDDKSALALGVAVSLLGTPVLWIHYLALLIVPLALFRPRLDRLWLVLLLLYACPEDIPSVWQITVALVISATVLVCLLRRSRERPATGNGTVGRDTGRELVMLGARS